MKRLSHLAAQGIPFLFFTNFDASKTQVFRLDQLKDEDIEYAFDTDTYSAHTHKIKKSPISYQTYKKGFDYIIEKIKSGDTYLLNYTCKTKIETPLSLKEIFTLANARFKLRIKDQFLCFSPERFIKIKNNSIYTYPMKGTIDASLPNAEAKILANTKEMAEHIMVVDLLRNDLSMVAKEVKVTRFRYIDKINAGEKELLQVSSEIQGLLCEDWKNQLGDILQTLLPAGSITGTPKRKTLEIIKEVENYERNNFSGVFGVFDGKSFDSAIMIRFIEKNQEEMVYKSGGGITLDSSAEAEYQEMLDKIYIP